MKRPPFPKRLLYLKTVFLRSFQPYSLSAPKRIKNERSRPPFPSRVCVSKLSEFDGKRLFLAFLSDFVKKYFRRVSTIFSAATVAPFRICPQNRLPCAVGHMFSYKIRQKVRNLSRKPPSHFAKKNALFRAVEKIRSTFGFPIQKTTPFYLEAVSDDSQRSPPLCSRRSNACIQSE